MGVKDWLWILEGESKKRFERASKGSGRKLLTRTECKRRKGVIKEEDESVFKNRSHRGGGFRSKAKK